MDELADTGEFLAARDPLLEKVLYGLDIVVGGLLDRLNLAGIVFGELRDDGLEVRQRLWGERRHLRDGRFVCQSAQPGNLDDHASSNQAELTEHGSERCVCGAVAAV